MVNCMKVRSVGVWDRVVFSARNFRVFAFMSVFHKDEVLIFRYS